jgi:hypothetical protein
MVSRLQSGREHGRIHSEANLGVREPVRVCVILKKFSAVLIMSELSVQIVEYASEHGASSSATWLL